MGKTAQKRRTRAFKWGLQSHLMLREQPSRMSRFFSMIGAGVGIPWWVFLRRVYVYRGGRRTGMTEAQAIQVFHRGRR